MRKFGLWCKDGFIKPQILLEFRKIIDDFFIDLGRRRLLVLALHLEDALAEEELVA